MVPVGDVGYGSRPIVGATRLAHALILRTGRGHSMQAFAATWGSDGVLYLEGELDLEAEEAAAGALRGRPDDQSDVVIDVSRLTFMDSTGIRVLQALALSPSATRVVVRSPSGGVRKVLELVGVAKRAAIAVPAGAPATASREDFFIF